MRFEDFAKSSCGPMERHRTTSVKHVPNQDSASAGILASARVGEKEMSTFPRPLPAWPRSSGRRSEPKPRDDSRLRTVRPQKRRPMRVELSASSRGGPRSRLQNLTPPDKGSSVAGRALNFRAMGSSALSSMGPNHRMVRNGSNTSLLSDEAEEVLTSQECQMATFTD
jgi:hypothetical protein